MAIVIQQLTSAINILNDSKPAGEQIIESLPLSTVVSIARKQAPELDVLVFNAPDGYDNASVKFTANIYTQKVNEAPVLYVGNIDDLSNLLNDEFFLSAASSSVLLEQTNAILEQIEINTGGNYLDFTKSNGIAEVDLGALGNERLLLLFRCDPTELDGVLVKNMVANIYSASNDDFLVLLGVAKTFDHVFIDDNFKDVDPLSKIQVAIPSLEGVPALVSTTGFSVGGRNIFQQFGKQDTTISVTNDNPALIPAGVYYSVTAVGISLGAKLASAANWAELQ